MNEICELLRPELILYAEGELGDHRQVSRVRRHLDGCPFCRAALTEHDRATRSVLRTTFPDAKEDFLQLLGRVEAAVPLDDPADECERRSVAIGALIDAEPLTRPGPSRSLPVGWFASIAALFLAAVGLVLASSFKSEGDPSFAVVSENPRGTERRADLDESIDFDQLRWVHESAANVVSPDSRPLEPISHRDGSKPAGLSRFFGVATGAQNAAVVVDVRFVDDRFTDAEGGWVLIPEQWFESSVVVDRQAIVREVIGVVPGNLRQLDRSRPRLTDPRATRYRVMPVTTTPWKKPPRRAPVSRNMDIWPAGFRVGPAARRAIGPVSWPAGGRS